MEASLLTPFSHLGPGMHITWPVSSRHLETLPSKSFMKPKRLRFPGPVNSRRWVFVREGLDDFRKGRHQYQHPKDVSLPHVHHRLSPAIPKKRQNGLPEGAALLSKLPQARKAFLEDAEDNTALHPLTLYPHLEEALPPQVICLGLGLRGCSLGWGSENNSLQVPRRPWGARYRKGGHTLRFLCSLST